MKKILITLFLIIIFTWGQSSAMRPSDCILYNQDTEWETFETDEFAIQYPKTWELNQEGLMGTSFILFAPVDNDEDQFRENVNLLVQDLTGLNMDIDQYTKISEGQISTLISNAKLIKSIRVKEGKNEYHKMIYTGDQGVFHLKYEQYYWVINDKAYVLTFTTEVSSYSKYQKIGESILNSFGLKK